LNRLINVARSSGLGRLHRLDGKGSEPRSHEENSAVLGHAADPTPDFRPGHASYSQMLQALVLIG
jgi:hypothetical protein